jgi:hypothetical protein
LEANRAACGAGNASIRWVALMDVGAQGSLELTKGDCIPDEEPKAGKNDTNADKHDPNCRK